MRGRWNRRCNRPTAHHRCSRQRREGLSRLGPTRSSPRDCPSSQIHLLLSHAVRWSIVDSSWRFVESEAWAVPLFSCCPTSEILTRHTKRPDDETRGPAVTLKGWTANVNSGCKRASPVKPRRDPGRVGGKGLTRKGIFGFESLAESLNRGGRHFNRIIRMSLWREVRLPTDLMCGRKGGCVFVNTHVTGLDGEVVRPGSRRVQHDLRRALCARRQVRGTPDRRSRYRGGDRRGDVFGGVVEAGPGGHHPAVVVPHCRPQDRGLLQTVTPQTGRGGSAGPARGGATRRSVDARSVGAHSSDEGIGEPRAGGTHAHILGGFDSPRGRRGDRCQRVRGLGRTHPRPSQAAYWAQREHPGRARW